ncbi:DNA repair protein REV1 isoform X2 [Gouania willdenowi]|uniref:DNA repair protein REV1 isoform X2 n=1 Tax=Gouania willdenowi TaxID=441366 RepID=UPI001054826B|nr:DNA repair protein REV1 isoform X2 [Gouania willdenowi]
MSRDGWMKKRATASEDNGWAERGGYMAAKVSKLDEQFKLDMPREKLKAGASSSIFSGVAIYVNGYTDPSADELRRLMMLHGGQFHVYYSRSKTTHIIANNLPNSKIKELKGEKVIKPQWITDSVQAGRLLPYLQYQLYSKQKGLLYPGMTLRQNSEIAGPSHGCLPKLHLPQRDVQPLHREPSSSSCQNKSVPFSTQPQSNQHSSAEPSVKPQPNHSASSHLIIDGTHRNSSQSHPLSAQTHTKHPLKSSQEVDFQMNGLPQTSLESTILLKTGVIKECSKESGCYDKASQAVKEATLTNGHSLNINGALKLEDWFPGEQQSSTDRDLLESRVSVSSDQPLSPPLENHTESDPYEFPHSPPKESKRSPVHKSPHGTETVNGQSNLSPSTHYEAEENGESHFIPEPLHQSELISDKTGPTPSSLRLNGSHHGVSSDLSSLTMNHKTSKPSSLTDKSSSSKTPTQLLEQTGDLISEYYSHSRLHQISTWRSGFSEYVNELHSKRKVASSDVFLGRDKLRKSKAQRLNKSQGTSASGCVKSCILHVDMDCFFVSVGIRNRPDLKGKPVAVTSNRGQVRVPVRHGANPQLELQMYQQKYSHPQQDDELHRSPSQESQEPHSNKVDHDASALSMAEIASCSYEARQAGVKNGMFFGKAKQLCPSLHAVPYDFEAYKEVALSMYEILAGYTHDIEALSCDEVLIDGSALLAEVGASPADLAKAIREDIEEKTGCCASVGMGSNILLARLATRKAKPNGQFFLKSEEVDDFIRDLPVTSLPGVGPVMGRKLAAIGVRSCGDLQQVCLSQLQKKFGPRTGQTLFRFCRGLDDRPVRYEKERKSVSAEMNYNIRFTKVDEVECFLTNLSTEVQKRLQEAGLCGRRVTLKLMVRKPGAPLEPAKYGGHGACDNLAKTVMLAQSTDSGQTIANAVIKLFHAMKVQVENLRGVGIQVQLLEGHQSTSPHCKGFQGRSIKDMFARPGTRVRSSTKETADWNQKRVSSAVAPPVGATSTSPSPVDVSVPGTSKQLSSCRKTPEHSRKCLNFSIEVPSPSQVDRSVLEALPAELREQVEQSWTNRDGRTSNCHSANQNPCPASPPRSPVTSIPVMYTPPLGTLVLQLPNEPDSPGIVLELPNFSQVDPDVFAALPKELQEELKSAYSHVTNIQPQIKTSEAAWSRGRHGSC